MGTAVLAPKLSKAGIAEERITLPKFCATYLHLPANDPARRAFARTISAKCSRIEARGGEIDYPLRMTRWGWYVEWNAFDARDEAETLADVRAASYPA